LKSLGKLRPKKPRQEAAAFSVLVVEDDAELATGIAAALAKSGIEVVTAHTGTDAMRLALQSPPDAVLLDLGLPDGHGYMVARALRKEFLPPEAAVVILTGSSVSDLLPAEYVGADLMMSKPVDTELLGGLLRHLHAQRKRTPTTR